MLQVREDIVDEITSSGVSVEVLTKVVTQLGFTLGGVFIRLLADLRNFLVLVVVIVTIVVVVLVVFVSEKRN